MRGLRQGCVLAPLLFIVFFTAILRVVEKPFLSDAAITDNMVRLQRKEKGEKRVTPRTGKLDATKGEGGEEGHTTHRQTRRAGRKGGGGADVVGNAVR